MKKEKICPIISHALISYGHFKVNPQTGDVISIHTWECLKNKCALWSVKKKTCGLI